MSHYLRKRQRARKVVPKQKLGRGYRPLPKELVERILARYQPQ